MITGFSTGDRIVHSQYGTGTLTEINERHTVIDFDEHGVRKFITNIVSFERTLVPAPERRPKTAKKGRKSTSS